MGFLKRMRRAEDEMLIANAKGSFGDDAAKWEPWASVQGWTYAAEAPELVGRYRPPYEKGAERYCNLLTTVRNGAAVTAFERWVHSYDPKNRRASGSTQWFVVVRLPGLPPADFTTLGPEKTIRQMGGTIPGDTDLELQGAELVASHQGRLEPDKLAGVTELLTRQINAVPSTFWH